MEPIAARSMPDVALALDRLRAASARYPGDVEFLEGVADFGARFDPEQGVASARKATELDPQDAFAWERLGDNLAALGDMQQARHAFERCASVSLESTDCFGWMARLSGVEGKCDQMEVESRRIEDIDPGAEHETILPSMLARDRPEAVVRDILGRALASRPPDQAAVLRADAEAVLAANRGAFDASRKALDEEEQAIAASLAQRIDWAPNVRLLGRRVVLARETGDSARARSLAQDFLNRRDVLTEYRFVVRFPVWPWWVWAAAGQSPDPARSGWVEEQLGKGMRVSTIWTTAWAQTASTPDEARAALDARARDARLRAPDGGEDLLVMLPTDAIVGHVFVLAGRPGDALAFLRRATSSCFVRADSFVHVPALLDLGQALEQTGDTKGACDAYGEVLARWGHATPRSASADTARAAVQRLHCAQ
jgi:serine/threonine-protein kinase